jgi:hypothetical protein
MLTSRVGAALARKYYEFGPQLSAAIIADPTLAPELIDLVAMVKDLAVTAEAGEPMLSSELTQPIISESRGKKIQRFLDIFRNSQGSLGQSMKLIQTALVLLSNPNALIPDDGTVPDIGTLPTNYLTFGDLIRISSGQLDEMGTHGNGSDGWNNYKHHLFRRLNPSIASHADDLIEVFRADPEEALVIAIERPELANQAIDIAVSPSMTNQHLKKLLKEVRSSSSSRSLNMQLDHFLAKL